MKTALIVVDVQNDFVHPSGSLFVSEQPVRAINKLVKEREYDHVVYTVDLHPPETSHFEQWPPHCVHGTWGAKLHRKLKVVKGSSTVAKGSEPDEDGYSGFYGSRRGQIIPTPLNSILTERRITHVDVVGVAYDVCVAATAIDASNLGFVTTVLKEYTASVNPADDLATKTRLIENNVLVDAWSDGA